MTQLMIGTALAIGMSMVAVSAIGSAVAHSSEEPTQVIGQKALLNPACEVVRREAEEDWGALDLPPEMFYRLCRRLPNNTQAICGSSTRTRSRGQT